jgi:hypothetical protein
VADGWCWFVLREKYCWLVAGGWFVGREKYCWLVADKPSEQAVRWLWYQWSEPDRPWVGMEVPCNELDKQLFRASTVVTVGNGLLARFWDSPWCEGHAPRDLAPQLYQLAWRKNRSLRDEVQGDKWTRGLWRMTTAEQMAEFVSLWSLVQEVQFNDSQDEIRWKWSADGSYSAKSAYNIQFVGSFCPFNSKAIWKAKVEGKHSIFTWLLVQQKMLTANNLQTKGIQCDPVCALCDQELEIADPLCLHCVFAKEFGYMCKNGLRILLQCQVLVSAFWTGGTLQPEVRRRTNDLD